MGHIPPGPSHCELDSICLPGHYYQRAGGACWRRDAQARLVEGDAKVSRAAVRGLLVGGAEGELDALHPAQRRGLGRLQHVRRRMPPCELGGRRVGAACRRVRRAARVRDGAWRERWALARGARRTQARTPPRAGASRRCTSPSSPSDRCTAAHRKGRPTSSTCSRCTSRRRWSQHPSAGPSSRPAPDSAPCRPVPGSDCRPWSCGTPAGRASGAD